MSGESKRNHSFELSCLCSVPTHAPSEQDTTAVGHIKAVSVCARIRHCAIAAFEPCVRFAI